MPTYTPYTMYRKNGLKEILYCNVITYCESCFENKFAHAYITGKTSIAKVRVQLELYNLLNFKKRVPLKHFSILCPHFDKKYDTKIAQRLNFLFIGHFLRKSELS